MHWWIGSLLLAASVSAAVAQRSGASQQLSPDIEFELARLIERRSLEEFSCSEGVLAGSSESFETRIAMSRLTAYYIAIITGRSNRTVVPSEITLAHGNQKPAKVAFQNAPFGAELSLQSKHSGDMLLRVRLEQKAAYRVLVCNMEASVYRTKEILPRLEVVP